MKTFLIIVAILMTCSIGFADEYTVESELIGFTDRDGLMAPGSPLNRYIITDSDTGQEIGTMESEMIGFDSGDSMMAPGGTLNPYIIKLND